jgi:signal transduction histidine kinase
MYLVVKELLNNSLRHSQGDQVSCQAICSDERIIFKLADNGRLSQEINIEQGHGVRNAQERVARQGGVMSINKGESLEIVLDVPLKGQISKARLLQISEIEESNPVDYLQEKTTAGEKVIV